MSGGGARPTVAIVTGATGGMGRVIARELAGRGMRVVTIARDARRADGLGDVIARGPGTLHVLEGDLSTREGVIGAAETIAAEYDAIHLLINNAGAHYPSHRLSTDGVEMHLAVDYLAGYGLTALLEDRLRRGRARVVNVASDTLRDTRRVKLLGPPRPVALGGVDLADLTRLNPSAGFVPFEAYARAKLLTVMAGYGLARAFAGDGVTVNAVHPGIVATDIIDDLVPLALRPARALIRRAMLTPEQGAEGALRLALDPALDGVSGRYFVRRTETPTPPVSYDRELQHRLRSSSDHHFGVAEPGDGRALR